MAVKLTDGARFSDTVAHICRIACGQRRPVSLQSLPLSLVVTQPAICERSKHCTRCCGLSGAGIAQGVRVAGRAGRRRWARRRTAARAAGTPRPPTTRAAARRRAADSVRGDNHRGRSL